MSLTLLFLLGSVLASIFTQITHPLAMGLMLLTQTLLVCLTTGLMAHSFWFSYILFLVFLGGLLVLFIYVATLASNETFSFEPYTLILLMSFSAMTIITLIFIDPLLTPLTKESAGPSLNPILAWNNELAPALMKLYNNPTNLITLMLALYLFLTLIAVVQITKIFYGPLRQSN
uniref:NADH-ubiquinone oxidoreductase chain 6 n=1 Tax=Neoperla bella TaxID=3047041 RepID=A0AA95Z8V6_9NEOP|nr:NADH dehydrogenase subunit 6 [Neoperla bella]